MQSKLQKNEWQNAKRKRNILLQNTYVKVQAIEIKKYQFYFSFSYSTEKLKE